MADDLNLLFRLRGDASGLKSATAEGRAAVNQLKQAFGPELAQTVSLANKVFSDIGLGLGDLTQRIPVVGNTVSRLTSLLRNVGVEGKTSEKAISSVANSIGNIARESGRSIPQVAQFLTRFTQIAGVAERDSAAVEFFGASLATKLTPQLAEARVALSAVTAESAAAGAGFAGLAVPIGIALIAVAALVAGLSLVSRELFTVSKNVAEFQGHMQDLSQQTGVAVETLSTLEVAVATTGGSLNTVTQALVQFQRQMDESLDPMSDAAGRFKDLGIRAEDTETALRQALRALAAMPEGFQQTNKAAELFGARGGKQILALLKEVNGDVDALQQNLRDTGLLITSDAARAADKFNDELALLDFQIRSAGAAIAKDLIPPLVELIQHTSELIQAVKPLLGLIGTVAGPTVRALAGSLRGASLVVQALTFDFEGLRKAIRESQEQARQGIPAIKVPDVSPVPLPAAPTTRQAAQEAATQAAELVAIAKRSAAEVNQALNTAFEQGRINRQQQVDDTIESNKRVLKSEKTLIQAEIDLENNKWKQIRDRRDLDETERQRLLEESAKKVRVLQQQELDAQSTFDITSRELRARAAKERADSLRAEGDNQTNILSKEFDRQIALVEARINREIGFETEGLAIIEQLERAKIDARREGLEKQKQIGFLTVEAQAEISRQIQQVDQEADALADAQRIRREQRLRQRSERIKQLKLDELQSILEAEQIAGESIIASIEAQAALRVRTEESAAREILRIRLGLIDDEQEALQAALTAAGKIVNADERLAAEAEINNRLRILKAQRTAIETAGNREVDIARQRDLDNERDYADDLREVQQRALRAQREAAEEVIHLMVAGNARRRDVIRAAREFDLAEEEDRHQRVTDSIRLQQRETDAEIEVLKKRLERLKVGTTEEIEEHDRLIESLERLRQKRTELDAQQQSEDERNQTRKRRVTIEADIQLADPDTALKDLFDGIAESITNLAGRFADLIGLGKEFSTVSQQIAQVLGSTLTGAFNQFANALGQTVANWVLLGETGPAVMRKILAQALASIAAEAAVNMVKELALGFAMLFLNPAASAAHFTAAGLWAAIAGGSALAGRAVAGDLFKPKTSSSGSGGRGSDSFRDRSERDPIDLIRQQLKPQELHVFVHTEPGGRFNEAVVAGVIDNVKTNGPMRTVIKEAGKD